MAVALALPGRLPAQDEQGAPVPTPPDQTTDQPTPYQGPGQSPAPAPGQEDASFQTFYDALSSQGTWIQSSDYGYVWQPQVNDPDWAPYTVGSWAYTDDGWTWVSDEPWGWATYHYGRWVNLDGIGWCWVPGYTWAPAWVSWRYGDGYVGWAPLPPDSLVGIDYSDDGSDLGVGFHIGGDCDAFYGIGAGWYIFLPVNCLGYRHYHGYYCNRGDNYAIINRTTNVTNLNVTKSGNGETSSGTRGFHRVTTGGPSLAQVNAVSQTPIEKVSLVRTNQPGGGGMRTGTSLALYAPQVNPGTTAQPSRVAGSVGQATINRGIDIMHPLEVNARLAPSPATEAQVQQARVAQDHVPAGAKVVTDSESVQPLLQGPLTSLKPTARQMIPSATFSASPHTMTPGEGGTSTPGAIPTMRTYPEPGASGGAPSRVSYPPGTVYPSGPSFNQPRSTATGMGGGSDSHQYARPTAPASSAPAAAPAQPSAGGSSGGSGGYSNGGGGRTQSGAGGGNGGNYQQQNH